MSQTPMHNRFAEGFLEPYSCGQSLDALSARIRPTPFLDLDTAEFHRRAAVARNAALAESMAQTGRELRALFRRFSPIKPLLARFRAWRERERAAEELFALDDRTLAELGLLRSDIPFVAAGGAPVRDRSPAEPAPSQAANSNDSTKHAA
jgi:uncharacterized protein YjiS (DUF1127 family)